MLPKSGMLKLGMLKLGMLKLGMLKLGALKPEPNPLPMLPWLPEGSLLSGE